MRTYTPATGLGSVVHDYSSVLYGSVYNSLRSLRERAVGFLSKVLYHVNIIGRLNDIEATLKETTADLSNQVGVLNQSLNVISKTIGEYKGHLVTLQEIRDILGEIANSSNVREQLEEKKPILERLLSTLPQN